MFFPTLEFFLFVLYIMYFMHFVSQFLRLFAYFFLFLPSFLFFISILVKKRKKNWLVGCGIKAYFLYQRPGPEGGVPSTFRDPSLYLREFQRKPRKTPKVYVDKLDWGSDLALPVHHFCEQNCTATGGDNDGQFDILALYGIRARDL